MYEADFTSPGLKSYNIRTRKKPATEKKDKVKKADSSNEGKIHFD